MPRSTQSRLDAQPRRAGLTLVEGTAGIGIVVLALIGFARVALLADLHPEADREQELVRQAGERILDDLRGTSLADVWALYNEDPFDDPEGVDTAPGNRIFVPGVGRTPDEPFTPIGRIDFPTVFDFDAGLQLREDVVDPALDMPRDLNGDGTVDHRDHADDYSVLPVRVRFEWTGVSGPEVVEAVTLLGGD